MSRANSRFAGLSDHVTLAYTPHKNKTHPTSGNALFVLNVHTMSRTLRKGCLSRSSAPPNLLSVTAEFFKEAFKRHCSPMVGKVSLVIAKTLGTIAGETIFPFSNFVLLNFTTF